MPALAQVFEAISTAKVSTSAMEARDMLILRDSDGITMNRRRLLADAKAKALELAKNYEEIGRAHVSTPVTNAHLVCRLMLEKKKNNKDKRTTQTEATITRKKQ